MLLYDAHNHLQDARFSDVGELISVCRKEGITKMVVNGAAEEDWPAVSDLASRFPEVIPSFGYHPWYIHERSIQWRENLSRFLDETPSAIGEIGLDRWKPGLDYSGQEEVFTVQLDLAADRNLPVSIHCLKAWGRLLQLLQETRRPACGFLLHSYGGSQEMVLPFAQLGAFFSFPGYFAHERKARQREAFKRVPPNRLLIETDAPDQLLPEDRTRHRLSDSNGQPINHPANLGAVYEVVAGFLGVPIDSLAARIEENFLRLFGGLCR